MGTSWFIADTIAPGKQREPLYGISIPKKGENRTLAYTMDVRVRRSCRDLSKVLGFDMGEKLDASEITEGLLLFGSYETADAYIRMHEDDEMDIFSIDLEKACKAMKDTKGVVVLISSDPPNPYYLRTNLLSIAYDIGDIE